jgi:hypothetical protein
MHTVHKDYPTMKSKAIALRLGGASYSQIEERLGVCKSTLSGWLGKLSIPAGAQRMIKDRKLVHLAEARFLAAGSHRQSRIDRMAEQKSLIYRKYADKKLDAEALELLLAALYLGEGVKKDNVIALANANPKIVSAFVNLVRWVYQADENRFKCFLHLRMDQSDDAEKNYWSNALSIPIEKFGKSQFDRRTLGKKTHLGYHGVCIAYYYDARLAHRLMALQECLLDKILTGA